VASAAIASPRIGQALSGRSTSRGEEDVGVQEEAIHRMNLLRAVVFDRIRIDAKVPRFPMRLDSEIDMMTSCSQTFRHSGNEVMGNEADGSTV